VYREKVNIRFYTKYMYKSTATGTVICSERKIVMDKKMLKYFIAAINVEDTFSDKTEGKDCTALSVIVTIYLQ